MFVKAAQNRKKIMSIISPSLFFSIFFLFPFSDYDQVNKCLKNKYFPGNAPHEKWLNFFMTICKDVMSEIALDQLLDLSIFCNSKIPEASRVWSGQTSLSDEELVRLRCVDSGSPAEFFLIFIDTGNHLTDELANDSDYIGLNDYAGRHVSIVNDLYSLKKEVRANLYKLNYVYVKMKNHNISAQVAVNLIIDEIYEYERMARVYGERLRKRKDQNLSQYVDAMYNAMAGNHYWSSLCKRYNS